MKIDDFFKDDERTNFVDRITAFLQIPTNKLKIVGIRVPTKMN